MFAIVAEKYQFVVGVDTHARKHVAVIVNSLGVVVARTEMKVTIASMQQFIGWVMTKVRGDIEAVLFAVEGTSSYGETLTNLLLTKGLHVIEVKPSKTKSRGGTGKTDQIDAELAAVGVLRLSLDKLVTPRHGDLRKSLRTLLSSRQLLSTQQTTSKNALIALLRGVDLGVDARKPLSSAEYQTIASWRVASPCSDLKSISKKEARRLAKCIIALEDELEHNKQALQRLVCQVAPRLLSEPGIGPVTLAHILCAYSHKGRIRSAEAFAALAGATPIPASSGNTIHYRLNRYGDRQLNHALHTIVLARMRFDETTRQYVDKRTKDGLSTRDIRRSLKRYVARSLFKQLEAYDIKP